MTLRAFFTRSLSCASSSVFTTGVLLVVERPRAPALKVPPSSNKSTSASRASASSYAIRSSRVGQISAVRVYVYLAYSRFLAVERMAAVSSSDVC